MIAQYAGKRHRDWDTHLPTLQFAVNSALHASTGYTPAYLNHGRELARPHTADRHKPGPADAPGTTRRRLEEAFELVRIQLARSFQKQERAYNLRRRDWRPRLGDTVWKRDRPLSTKSQGFSSKLAPKFIGPLKVGKIISPVIVDLKDSRGK